MATVSFGENACIAWCRQAHSTWALTVCQEFVACCTSIGTHKNRKSLITFMAVEYFGKRMSCLDSLHADIIKVVLKRKKFSS